LKIYLSYKTKTHAWGGGNQFIKNLSKELNKKNLICDRPGDADLILFNSHHNLIETLKLKLKYPKKKFIHRIDGPISSYRGNEEKWLDDIIYLFNKTIADGTIFLSKWSRDENKKTGFNSNNKLTVIYNSANNKVFKEKRFLLPPKDKKIKLISSSWSTNFLKGFKVFKYLDENLDFNKYEMTFIGNSKIKFKNIKMIPPVNSEELSNNIYQSHIFIFASKIESCSNLLIEAMSTNIPILLIDGTSNNEIFNSNGFFFKDEKDVIYQLEKLINQYDDLEVKKKYFFDETTKLYIDFFQQIINDKIFMEKVSLFKAFSLYTKYLLVKVRNKIKFLKEKYL
tara:strand:+ start:1042 stop:2058 length:1017 start_codon:yes stop_codon:yes gene_type:complete